MAQQANLQAASRTTTGKGAARSLRRDGKIPGVIYGHGREAEAVTIDKSALNKMLFGISAGTTILDVAIDGRAPVKALIRDIQRDSLRPAEIIHLDLYEVRSDEEITLAVPIRLIGIPDDMIDTAGTMAEAVTALKRLGARDIYCCATHALLSGPAVDRLMASPVKEVAVTNTIAIPPERRFDRLKVLSIAGLLAKAIGYTHSDQSVSSLFD